MIRYTFGRVRHICPGYSGSNAHDDRLLPSSVVHWDSLDQGKFADETATVRGLLARLPLDGTERAAVLGEAVGLVERARASVKKQGVVESFLQEFSLGTREGLALMCLAEALLRTPDEETRDRLIAERSARPTGRPTSASLTACSSTPRPGA